MSAGSLGAGCLVAGRLISKAFLWPAYDLAVRSLGRSTVKDIPPDPEFRKHGVLCGSLPREMAEALARVWDEAPKVDFKQEDSARDYVFNANVRYDAAGMNQSSAFLLPGPAQLESLRPVVRLLERPVAACLGAPWRILNIRALKNFPSPQDERSNDWHTDHLPLPILKVMIYLSEVGPDKGTTEIRLRDGRSFIAEGPAGTWVVFRISELLHRRVPPQSGFRRSIELTVAPSHRMDLEPVFKGMNAQYPYLPWSGIRRKKVR